MTKVIEIDGRTCGDCLLNVKFFGKMFCAITEEETHYRRNCYEGTNTEEFVKNHDIYKDLQAERDELERKLEEVPSDE